MNETENEMTDLIDETIQIPEQVVDNQQAEKKLLGGTVVSEKESDEKISIESSNKIRVEPGSEQLEVPAGRQSSHKLNVQNIDGNLGEVVASVVNEAASLVRSTNQRNKDKNAGRGGMSRFHRGLTKVDEKAESLTNKRIETVEE